MGRRVATDVYPIFGSWKEGGESSERDGGIDATNMNISLPEISKDLVHDVRPHEVIVHSVCDVLRHYCAVSTRDKQWQRWRL